MLPGEGKTEAKTLSEQDLELEVAMLAGRHLLKRISPSNHMKNKGKELKKSFYKPRQTTGHRLQIHQAGVQRINFLMFLR